MASTEIEHPSEGSVAANIATMVVRCLREYTGRGPTKARAYVNSELITVVLQDTLTRGERSLAHDGHADVVLRTRHAYQKTMQTVLVTGIEQLTGRRVIAFLSDNHIDPDVAVESFVLAPVGDGLASGMVHQGEAAHDGNGLVTEGAGPDQAE